MIVRVWRGRTSADKAAAYKKFLRETAYSDYGDVEGNRGWMLLARDKAESVEVMFISLWDSMQALARYAGGDPHRPKYYPEDRAALLDLPDRVDHFEVVDVQIPRGKSGPSGGSST
jgi:heme-degrading monooxygenase HmoA